MGPRSMSNRHEPQAAEDAVMDDAPTSHQPAVEYENDVPDEPAGGEEEEEGEEDEEGDDGNPLDSEENMKRIAVLPGSVPTSAAFEFRKEGHTLGNALRYIIMKNPDVELCAYAIPHPSEDRMTLRVQTYEGTAIAALEKGLKDLQELCDVVAEKFWSAREKFGQRAST